MLFGPFLFELLVNFSDGGRGVFYLEGPLFRGGGGERPPLPCKPAVNPPSGNPELLKASLLVEGVKCGLALHPGAAPPSLFTSLRDLFS